MGHAPERKEAVLQKMLPPLSLSVPELSKLEGIARPTLYGWRREALLEGRLVVGKGNKKGDGRSSAQKFAAVLETAPMSEAERAEWCRTQGVHLAELDAWRSACEGANDARERSTDSAATRTAARKSEAKTRQLEKELARKDKALAEAAALLVLREKLRALRGEDEDG